MDKTLKYMDKTTATYRSRKPKNSIYGSLYYTRHKAANEVSRNRVKINYSLRNLEGTNIHNRIKAFFTWKWKARV